MDNLILVCQHCGIPYSKYVKPIIMPCTHNSCSKCIKLNKNNLKCLECGKINKKSRSKYPTNFLLLTLVTNNDDSKKPKEELNNKNFFYYCKNCNMKFFTDFHKTKYQDHIISPAESVDEEKCIEEMSEKGDRLKNNFKDFNDKLVKKVKNYFSQLLEEIEREKNFDFGPFDAYHLLRCCGIINPADQKRLTLFNKKILQNEIYSKILDSYSFEEMITKLENVDKKNENYLTKDKFFSLLFYRNEIYEKKLINLDEKLGIIKDKLKQNSQYIREFLEGIGFNTHYNFNESLKMNDYRVGSYLSGNDLIIFEPIHQEFKAYKLTFPFEGNPVSHFVTNNNIIYLLSNKNEIFQVNFITNKVIKLKSPSNYVDSSSEKPEQRIFYFHNVLYIFTANGFEALNINEDMENNKWEILNAFPTNSPIIKPSIVHCNFNSLGVVDLTKKGLNELITFNTITYKWKKMHFKFSLLDNILPINMKIVYLDKNYIVGGIDTNTGMINEKIFEIYGNKSIKIWGKLELIKEGYEIVQIDFAYHLEKVYFVIIYKKLVNEKEELSFDIWSKNTKDLKFLKIQENVKI